MKKIAQSIVRLRKLILTVAVLLLIPSAIGAVATRINYDVLTYLCLLYTSDAADE